MLEDLVVRVAGAGDAGVCSIQNTDGIEEIVELDLSDDERTALQASADAVREVVGVLTT